MKYLPVILFFALMLVVGFLREKIPDWKAGGSAKRKQASSVPAAAKAPALHIIKGLSGEEQKKEEAQKDAPVPAPVVKKYEPATAPSESNAAPETKEAPEPGDAPEPKEAPQPKEKPQPSPNEQKWAALAALHKLTKATPFQSQDWKDFWSETFPTLPEEIKPQVYYEGCLLQADVGVSGMHFGANPYAPFSFLGYPTDNDEWFGVAFRINPACFGSRNVTLYYTDQDICYGRIPWKSETPFKYPPYWDGTWTGMKETILKYSSGIGDIAICSKYTERQQEDRPLTYIRFRLDASKIKRTVELSCKEVSTDSFGGYTLVIPRIGEYNCALGEIICGDLVPLLNDSYCLK